MRFCPAALLTALILNVGCDSGRPDANVVVVYTSVDDVFARPVAQAFERNTGIAIKLVTDTEETKSTGLLNRLIAEKSRPQADVFWSGDPVRAAILKRYGIAAPYRSPQAADLPKAFSDPEYFWTGFSARARVLLYNTDRLGDRAEPRSIHALLAPELKNEGCIANPLFGTTSMHAAALFQVLGESGARELFEGLRQNAVRVVSSNGEVRRRVAAGECTVGLTDTDDAHQAIREGKPVKMVYPDREGFGTLIVPNAVVLITGAAHPEQGKAFIDYLLSPEVERMLAESEAAQIPLRSNVQAPSYVVRVESLRVMPVKYDALASELERLSRGFLKEWVAQTRK